MHGIGIQSFKQNFEVDLMALGKDVKVTKVKVAILPNTMDENGWRRNNTLKLTDKRKEDYGREFCDTEEKCRVREIRVLQS